MKKLISSKEAEEIIKSGKKCISFDENTIITAAAKDSLKAAGIKIGCSESDEIPGVVTENKCSSTDDLSKLDAETIYKFMKALSDKGLLSDLFDKCCSSTVPSAPYLSEKDPCGLKVIKGNTVKYEALDTGNPNDKVFYQEVINADDKSPMNSGFITIEKCEFAWVCECNEIYHIIDGTLTVNVNGKVYTANAGDSVFFPKGADVKFGSPNKMKAFYSTY